MPTRRLAAPATGMTLASTATTSSPDLEATKQALAHARAGRSAQASDMQRSIQDPVARKLIEWAILRSDSNSGAARYIAFVDDNPDWPSTGAIRRRAEAILWTEQPSPGAVKAFFSRHPPLSAKGRFALARALIALGDRTAAQTEVRYAWQNDPFGGDLETQAMETFSGMITAADHKARMDMRLYADDSDAGLRSANRVGGSAPAIAKARIAVTRKAHNAKSLLDAVPAAAHHDLGYAFSLAQWHRRAKRFNEAADVMIAAGADPAQAVDGDQWWTERRLVARGLLDAGNPKKAYRIAREAVRPSKENPRSEQQFTAGWIALRFLNDPAAALPHFVKVADEVTNVITLARSHYWQGRALEAMGRSSDARAQYRAAAEYSTAYYGQLAAARLGQSIVLRNPPSSPRAPLEVVRAVELLYATGNRDMVTGALADLGERSTDATGLAALGEVAARNDDARSMLMVGKPALGRGLPLEHYAFPINGMPKYHTVGPEVEKSLVYAIARQESTFNPGAISKARAMGLMQVTPGAGRNIARKYNVAFNERKMLSDPAYNVQLGAAELGTLLEDFRGSYIMAFVGYNAGRGRLREWVTKYGDPRDSRVDPVDWVERIPISETRYYIQRVMENMQVYRARFGAASRLTIEADLRRGAGSH